MTSSHDRRDRGASAVEYALLLTLFVLGTLGALRALAGGMSEQFQRQSDHVAADPAPSRSGDDGGGGGAPPAPEAGESTTTTAPPATTTSTTEAGEDPGEQVTEPAEPPTGPAEPEPGPTPGTAPEPEVVVVEGDELESDGDRPAEGGATEDPVATTAWSGASAEAQNRKRWSASATLVVLDADGSPLTGRPWVQIRVVREEVDDRRVSDDSGFETVRLAHDGSLQLRIRNLERVDDGDGDRAVRFEVVQVRTKKNGGSLVEAWDGQRVTVRIEGVAADDDRSGRGDDD